MTTAKGERHRNSSRVRALQFTVAILGLPCFLNSFSDIGKRVHVSVRCCTKTAAGNIPNPPPRHRPSLVFSCHLAKLTFLSRILSDAQTSQKS